jgi:molybdopterin-containing oxidoreductase family iron-sulfur binding subunit
MSLINIKGTGKKYWRSLDELADKPEFHEWVHREFPEGASEMLDGASRRNVLKLMAASFGLAGLTACRRPAQHILPNVKGIEDYIPGQPYFYATAMPLGGTVLPLLVETHDGRPTKIEGNPDHPYSLGAASAFAQASVLSLYDPDRSKTVLENGRESSWEEFSNFAAGHFAKAGDGSGIRFLSVRNSSPSLAAIKKYALEKWPKAKWIEYEPVNNDTRLEGAKLAFGQAFAPRAHYGKAKVILSLDSDFLGLDASTVLPIKQFTKGRKAAEPGETEMNRLYSVESNYSLTGGMADHRLRLRSSEVQAFATDVARELGFVPAGLKVLGASDKRQKFIAAVAKDLKANAGKCLVVAGRRQPAAVHALAFLMNEKLGNIGATLTFTKSEFEASAVENLGTLAGEMSRGEVQTLVILGGNPVYTSPSNLQFEGNLKKVPVTIHLGLEEDETAAAVKWHLPEAHYLETWGDGRTPDGSATIQQPMIEPLYGGKPAAEVVAMLAGYKDRQAFDIVRNYWIAQWPAATREKTWREALHNGMVPDTATPEVKPPAANAGAIAAAAQQTAGAAQGLEVTFYPSYSVYDGRFANNGWLQECPDAMTTQVWGNSALISPATAKRLNIETGDIVKLERGGASTEFAVTIQPGHADDAVSLTLGYGRTRCGRVGREAGYNAYALRTSDGFWFQGGWSVTKTGKSVKLATTQEHNSMEGRPLVREASLEEFKKSPKFAEEASEVPPLVSIYGDQDYSQGYQWGMTIDLNACIGCNACTVACQSENNIPIVGKDQVMRGRHMHWIRIDRYYSGKEEDPEVVHQSVACQQCENAPCENVCPVNATVHSPEGLNEMVYNRCVGTRYCANNCPYKVRRFNFLNYHKNIVEVEKMVHNPNVSVRMRGVMEKCNYCVQRIQEGKIRAKTDGRRTLKDGEVVTACQQTCPADAIVFGNINDPESRVAKLKKQERNYAILAELDVKPRTTYLAKLRNPNPELA